MENNNEKENQQPGILLKPYTLKELADLYGVSRKTMMKWRDGLAEELGEKRGKYYNIKQVKIFFEELGIPKSLYHEN